MHLVIKTEAVERLLNTEFIAMLNNPGLESSLTTLLKEKGLVVQLEIKTADDSPGPTTPQFITITND